MRCSAIRPHLIAQFCKATPSDDTARRARSGAVVETVLYVQTAACAMYRLRWDTCLHCLIQCLIWSGMTSGMITIDGSSLDDVTLSGVTSCEYDEATLRISFCCMERNVNANDTPQVPSYSSSIFLPSSGPFYLLKVTMSILLKSSNKCAACKQP